MTTKATKVIDKRQNNSHKTNLWGMIRDVCVASMNKGQFPIAIFGAIIIILILKMSSEDSSKLVFELMGKFSSLYLLGWFLFIVVIMCWYFSNKNLRRIQALEMKRVTEEKKILQEQLTKRKLQTSNN